MDTQHTEQTKRLEEDMRYLGNRFDRHLEIYAANGKELSAVKQNVASLEKTIIEFYSSFKIHESNQQKVLNNFVTRSDFSTVKNIVYGAVSVVMTAVLLAAISLIIK